jgi:hypothetical protein
VRAGTDRVSVRSPSACFDRAYAVVAGSAAPISDAGKTQADALPTPKSN